MCSLVPEFQGWTFVGCNFGNFLSWQHGSENHQNKTLEPAHFESSKLLLCQPGQVRMAGQTRMSEVQLNLGLGVN